MDYESLQESLIDAMRPFLFEEDVTHIRIRSALNDWIDTMVEEDNLDDVDYEVVIETKGEQLVVGVIDPEVDFSISVVFGETLH